MFGSLKNKNNRYLLLTLFFALLNMGAIFLIFGFKEYSDSRQYIDVMRWFQGEDVLISPRRALTPLGPLLALPFEFLGQGAGLIVQNAVFYLLCALLIFKIIQLIYQNERMAFFASLFFITATPVIEVGLAYLVDTGGWFFYLLSIYLTLLYFKTKKTKLIPLMGFLSGLGILIKESGGLGIAFFSLMMLFSRDFTVRQKILKIPYFGVFFLIPTAIVQLLMFQHFHFTSLDVYFGGKASTAQEGVFLTYLRYLGQFFRILGILWPLVLIGLWQELRKIDWDRLKIFLALIPSSFSFLLWSTGAGARTVFLFAPLGIILATKGLSFLETTLSAKKRFLMAVFLFSLIFILNYFFAWINPRVAFVDRIVEFLLK